MVDEATRPALTWVAGLDNLDDLTGYRPYLVGTARHLAGAGASVVSGAFADVNDALTVRILTLVEARLGPPPCAYAWLTLGSGGRREEALHSDQDNAVAYESVSAAAYFADLAELTVNALAGAGLPRCPGGYLATRWRHSLAEWERIFRRLLEQPDPQALVQAEVLLDFRPVRGTLSPAPLDAILRSGGDRPRLAVQMARAAVSFNPPVGLFGRLRASGGNVDLKRAGIASIVLLARLYALAAGSVVRPTTDRLAAAADGGTLSRDAARHLTDAYRLLTELRLAEQLRAIEVGGQPGHEVRLDTLGPAQRHALTDALRTVRDLQELTARRYHTDAVS